MNTKLIAHRPTPTEVMLHRAKLGMMGVSSGVEPIFKSYYYKKPEI